MDIQPPLAPFTWPKIPEFDTDFYLPPADVVAAASPGQIIAVYSSDSGSRTDIPKWVEKASHRVVGVETRDGYDEIIVEKTH